MSRFYKHTPRAGDTKDKFFKNYANRRLRRKQLTHSYQHKSYKKDFCTWNICDYENVGTTFKEFYNFRVKLWSIWHNEPLNRDDVYRDYLKWFLRK